MRRLSIHLPSWLQDWLEILIPASQILLILFAAWLINLFFKRVIYRAGAHYALPRELLVPLRGVIRWLIIAATVLLILERLGVSATVLWTAFTGFATVRHMRMDAAFPAAHHALEDQRVRDLQQRAFTMRHIFQRRVEHVDVDHAALGAGLFRGVQQLDVVAQ